MKRTVLSLLLLVPVAAADRLTFQFEQESLETVLNVINTMAGRKVTLDPELKGARVDIELKNATVDEALDALAKAAGGAVLDDRIVPLWKDRLLATLEKTTLRRVQMDRVPLDKLLRFLRTVTGANFVADGGGLGARTVELAVDGVSVEATLDLVAEANGIAWEMRYGVVFLATKERLEALPAHLALETGAKRVDLPFEKTAFRGVVGYLKAASGEKLVVRAEDKDALEAVEVTAQANGLTIAQALGLVLLPNGATAERTKDAIVIRRRGR